MEAVEPYHRRAIDRWYDTTVECSEDSFWLDVRGDSMTSPAGLSIPEGMAILVDPQVEAINGKLVVAKLDGDNEATFKKLVIDAGQRFLKPSTPIPNNPNQWQLPYYRCCGRRKNHQPPINWPRKRLFCLQHPPAN
jgi:SOS-response transcriptional repressor LexA